MTDAKWWLEKDYGTRRKKDRLHTVLRVPNLLPTSPAGLHTMRHLEPRCQTPRLHLGAGAACGARTEVQVQDSAEQGPAPSVQGAARCKRPAPRCMHRTVAGRPSDS